jgi:4-hydroxy-tetrahydrodipicolinate reductase
MRVIISGALGRMGKELSEAAQRTGVTVACGVDALYANETASYPLFRTFEEVTPKADVLIDFSVASNLTAILNFGLKERLALVLCVTGYTPDDVAAILEASKRIPILQSANMSFGVQVLLQLTKTAARILGSEYDIEIVEKHHNKKVDSPSGTALMLAAAINGEREPMQATFGRYGKTGERAQSEIGIHAVRGGTVSGEHEVGFYGPGEELLITHRAENRALFAGGALRGAAFLLQQPPGLYSLADAAAYALEDKNKRDGA